MPLDDYGLDEITRRHFLSLGLEGTELGRVLSSDGIRAHVITDQGEVISIASGKLKKCPEGLPVVGDWVVIKEAMGPFSTVMVLPRRTKISRKAPGTTTSEQLVAANVDTIFVIMGLDGDFNIRRLERYLVLVQASGAECAVLLNKCDIIDDTRPLEKKVNDIAGGIPVLTISALKGTGLEQLKGLLIPRSTVCLLGSSGSGKSTLINRLMGEDLIKTSEVGFKDRGRHTTTSRDLYLLGSGALMIDNPGIREIQLWAEGDDVEMAFKEIHELSVNCKFKDCQHLSEPHCAVLGALEKGKLSKERYESYQKMKRELNYSRMRAEMSPASAERARWRGLKKDVKKYYKYKKGRE